MFVDELRSCETKSRRNCDRLAQAVLRRLSLLCSGLLNGPESPSKAYIFQIRIVPSCEPEARLRVPQFKDRSAPPVLE